MTTGLTLDPRSPPLQAALAHYHAGRVSEAEELCWEAIDADPDNAEAHDLLGVILSASGQLEAAVQVSRTAVTLRPSNAVFLTNLAHIYNQFGQPEQARECCLNALSLAPALAVGHNNLGNALKLLGLFAEAERSYEKSVALEPSARAQVNLGLSRLLRGDYLGGFALFEQRWHDPVFLAGSDLGIVINRLAAVPRWQGEPLHGRTMLVWSEQGLGDSLMSMRFLPLLKQRGLSRLTVLCEAALARAMACITGVDAVVTAVEDACALRFDLQCPMMSLPHVLRVQLDTIPRDVPYLRAPPALRGPWQARLAGLGAPRIGLVWSGSQFFPRRNMELAHLHPLFELSGATWISLQKGDAAQQMGGRRYPLVDWMQECADLLDTAALVSELDLVISVDTSVAHLAGALGKPVWLITRFESEWRWMHDREDSPWYPTMRLFRQTRRGRWDDVIDTVAAALQRQFGLARPLRVRLRRQARRLWRGGRG